MPRIVRIDVADLRFPTSRALDGSDAMNPDPAYSAAYATVHTDADDGLVGNGFTFTIGRGNELCLAAIEALVPLLVGRKVSGVLDDLGETWRILRPPPGDVRAIHLPGGGGVAIAEGPALALTEVAQRDVGIRGAGGHTPSCSRDPRADAHKGGV